MLNKDFAICIHTLDYSETSQIVTFFTRENGKISAIAKGSKRPKSSFDGPIEIFSHGGIVFSDSTEQKLLTLTELEQRPPLRGLLVNPFALNCAMLATELLGKLTKEHDPHPQLFDSFHQFLQNISQSPTTSNQKLATMTLLILFQLSLLKEIGLQPVLDRCVNCKTKLAIRDTSDKRQATSDELYFSSSANGIICKDCEANFPDKIRLSSFAARTLNNLKLLADAETKTLYEIEKILIHHFTETIGSRPKLAKYILIK